MPTDQHPLKVFLSYASQDKTTVLEIYSALKRESWIDPWLDKERILPGQDWQMVIETAVDEADVVIICLSNQSVSKEGYVQREIKYAYDIALEKPEGTIFLIPLRLDECEIPRKLRFLHRVDYFGVEKDNSYSHLLDALNVRYDQKLRAEDDHRARQERERTESKVAESTAMPKEEEKAQEVIKDQKLRKLLHLPKSIEVNLRIIFFFIIGVIILRFFVPDIIAAFRGETPVPTITPTEESTLIPTVVAGRTRISEKDGMVMVYVLPVSVLDAFWIDLTEVTNAMYGMCVQSGDCESPITNSYSHSSYYGESEFDEYPVLNVNWHMANTYCGWAGRRLPTELEWEYAASGGDGRIYPWGNNFESALGNFCDQNCDQNWADNTVNDGYADTAPVNSFLSGASPFGILNMAGNVWEWTSTSKGSDMVLKGGSWWTSKANLMITDDQWIKPSSVDPAGGFRCAMGMNP